MSFDLSNLSRLPFPTFSPSTCHCIARLDTKVLIQKCRTHDNYADMILHNHTFDTIRNPTDSQLDTQTTQRRQEKDKAEFGRR